MSNGSGLSLDPRGIGGALSGNAATFQILDVSLIFSSISGRVTIENPAIVGGVAGSVLGTPLGLATLDANGYIPLSQLPFLGLVGITDTTTTALGVSCLTSQTIGVGNTATGVSGLSSLLDGSYNTMMGYGVGAAIVGQDDNSGYGYNAMASFTGSRASGFGSGALASAASDDNTGYGRNALRYATGTRNTVFGGDSMSSTGMTGSDNTGVGYGSQNGTGYTGSRNTTIGNYCMTSNSLAAVDCTYAGYRSGMLATADYCTGIGAHALENGSGAGCTAVGNSALFNVTGSYITTAGHAALTAGSGVDRCIAFGAFAFGGGLHAGTDCIGFGTRVLYNNTSGQYNVCMGHGTSVETGDIAGSGYHNTSGSENTGLGAKTVYWNTTGSGNTAGGTLTLGIHTTSSQPANAISNNTAVGARSMMFQYSGDENTAVGVSAMLGASPTLISPTLVTQNRNTAIGVECINIGYIAVTENVCFGRDTLKNNGTSTLNAAFGYQSMLANVATVATNAPQNNVAFGRVSLRLTGGGVGTAAGNTAVGHAAMGAPTATVSNCTAVGISALNTIDVDSATAVGNSALILNGSGTQNTAFGSLALQQVSTGGSNTGFGRIVGTTLTTGSNNTILGTTANVSLNASANRISIGNAASTAANNTARIGTAALTGGVESFGAYSNISDVRSKRDIADCALGLEFIESLRVRQFRMVGDNTDRLHYGVIAQELTPLVPADTGIVKYSEEEDLYFVGYSELLAPIMRSIEELRVMVAAKAG